MNCDLVYIFCPVTLSTFYDRRRCLYLLTGDFVYIL